MLGGGLLCSSSRRAWRCATFPLVQRRHQQQCSSMRSWQQMRVEESTSTGIRSPDLVEVEYANLNLKGSYGRGQVGHVRIRQHVNPLSSSFSEPTPPPDWNLVFQDSSLPLMVDIGCGSGRFLLWLAKNSPQSRNYLGLEIREKLVQRSQFWVKDLSLNNIHFMFVNATISFESLVSTYPGPLTVVSILCPDPHFKKRHHKRRVLQKPLVESISKNLCLGGQAFLQSDVLEVALDMRNQFDALSDVFEHIDAVDSSFLCDPYGWLLHNPMGIRTEREIHAELEGATIYRRVYEKQKHSDLNRTESKSVQQWFIQAAYSAPRKKLHKRSQQQKEGNSLSTFE